MSILSNVRSSWTIFIVALLLGLGSTSVGAQSLNKLEVRGRTLLTRMCAACHAVDARGRSRHILAPAFRTIGQRYDIDDLVERLREGFTAPHPDMPTFRLTRNNALAVQAYLKAIQE